MREGEEGGGGGESEIGVAGGDLEVQKQLCFSNILARIFWHFSLNNGKNDHRK